MRSFLTWSQLGNRGLVTQLFLLEKGLPLIYCHTKDCRVDSFGACAKHSAKPVQRSTTADVNTTTKKLHSGCTAFYTVVHTTHLPNKSQSVVLVCGTSPSRRLECACTSVENLKHANGLLQKCFWEHGVGPCYYSSGSRCIPLYSGVFVAVCTTENNLVWLY